MVMTNEAAARILTNYLLHDLDTVRNAQVVTALMVALEEMDRMRKIEKVTGTAEQIKCKQCVHGFQSFGKLRCKRLDTTMPANGYCSFGEAEE